MKVINKRNNKLIADKVKVANNPFSRFIGLLNRSSIAENEGLFLTPCRSIHSFGMRFSFDAVFLDKDNQVKHLIKVMKPWKISPIVKTAYNTLELSAGTIDNNEIKIGDTLEFQD